MGKIWTQEECAALAIQCTTRTEFLRKHQTAYHAAHSHGWLDRVCSHMPKRAVSGPYKWSDEKIRSTISKFTDVSSFRGEQESLYVLLHVSGRFDRFAGHLDRARHPNGYWTKERCAEATQECVTRTDFAKRFPAAADAAQREGWMRDVCAHMARIGNHKMRCVYVIKTVGARRVYVGMTAHPRRRYAHHLSHPPRYLREFLGSPHRFRVVSGYMDLDAALALETRLAAHLRRKGYEVLNKTDGGQPGGHPTKWTRAALKDLVAGLADRGQMFREHSGAYDAASRAGIVDELFADHRNRGFGDGPVRDWTVERLQAIADQCESARDMCIRFDKAWQAANRRGIVSQLFADRPGSGATYQKWDDEAIRAAAAPFRSQQEFRNANRSAWRAAYRRGLIPELFRRDSTNPAPPKK